MDTPNPFMQAFRGYLVNLLRWEELDALWTRLREVPGGTYYLYAVGELPPVAPASGEQLAHFIMELDALLRREHGHDYCGIVYVDDRDAPGLIKIYDPNNLGSVCGSAAHPCPAGSSPATRRWTCRRRYRPRRVAGAGGSGCSVLRPKPIGTTGFAQGVDRMSGFGAGRPAPVA